LILFGEVWNQLAADKHKEISNMQNAALKQLERGIKACENAGKNINVHITLRDCSSVCREQFVVETAALRRGGKIICIQNY
jgi:hypothetical protein